MLCGQHPRAPVWLGPSVGQKSRGRRRVNGRRYFPAASLLRASCVPLLTAWLLKLPSPVSSLQVLASTPNPVHSKPGGGDSTLFYFFNICLFIWPHWVLVMAPRIFAASCRTFGCCIWTLCLWRGLWYLQLTGSVVVAYSSPCGILSSSPRNRARVSCIAGWILHHWAIGKFCHPGFFYKCNCL